MDQNTTQDIDVSSANQVFGKAKGEQIFINYTAKKFRLSESEENVFFSEVMSCVLISKILDDNSEKVAKYTFVITGLMSSYYSVSVQGGGLFDIILSFAITGVIWGGIAYAIASFFKKEKWIFNVTSTSNEFSIKMDKLDGERISRIFENHIPIIHDQKNELKNLEFKTETHEKKQSSLTPEKYNELVRLKSLLDQQIISEDEFKSLKDNLLTK